MMSGFDRCYQIVFRDEDFTCFDRRQVYSGIDVGPPLHDRATGARSDRLASAPFYGWKLKGV